MNMHYSEILEYDCFLGDKYKITAKKRKPCDRKFVKKLAPTTVLSVMAGAKIKDTCNPSEHISKTLNSITIKIGIINIPAIPKLAYASENPPLLAFIATELK